MTFTGLLTIRSHIHSATLGVYFAKILFGNKETDTEPEKMSLDTNTLPFESKSLVTPTLEEVKSVLTVGLKNNFKDVLVEVIDCPNLTQAPFHLAAKGICGRPVLLEFGGVPYLLPFVDRTKVYDLKKMCEKAVEGENYKEFFVCGAGAGPFPYLGTNVEVSRDLYFSLGLANSTPY